MSESENNLFLEVNGCKVYFETIGSGDNPVLLIPGFIGTGRTDFEELLDGDDELDFEKFTAVAVDPPGLGRSTPPVRKYGDNVYNNDCECYHSIMKHLGYDKYSIIGFSEGARVALLMAAKYPESIKSLTLSGLTRMYSLKSLITILSDNSVDKWNKSKLNSYLKVYKTKDEIQKFWNRYLKFIEFFQQYFPEDIFKDKYDLVECPVLLTHGDKDPLVEWEEPLEITKRLKNARLHRFRNGDHESHRKYDADYSKLVQDYILNGFKSSEEGGQSNPESIKSLTLSGLTRMYIAKSLKTLLSDKSVDKWNKSKLDSYLKVYETKDEIQKLWNRYLKFIEYFHQYFPKDIFKDKYDLVKCHIMAPLTHWDKDPLIELEETLNITERLDPKLHLFANRGHESYPKYHEYSKLLQDHILYAFRTDEIIEINF